MTNQFYRISYNGKQVSVTWAEGFKKGEDRRVAINYTVDSPITGMLFSYPDDSYPNRPIFAATDNETERFDFLPLTNIYLSPSLSHSLSLSLSHSHAQT